MTALLKVLFAIVAFVGVAATRRDRRKRGLRNRHVLMQSVGSQPQRNWSSLKKGSEREIFVGLTYAGPSCGARRGGD